MSVTDGGLNSEGEPGAAAGRPARAWLAALLSLAFPGAGQLYAARPWLALIAWIATVAGGVLALMVIVHAPNAAVIAIAVVAFVALYLAQIVHAWRAARASGRTRRPARGVLALVLSGFAVAQVGASSVVTSAVRANIAEPFRVPGSAMEPAIVAGDYIWAVPRKTSRIARDAVIVYRFRGQTLLKRAIGLPGDTVEMRDMHVYRNGALVTEPYAIYDSTARGTSGEFVWQRRYMTPGSDTAATAPTIRRWGPLVVPPARLFVLGDNRDQSLDSRYVGFIVADSVKGFPVRVYFSYDADRGHVRWSRIGRRID